MLRLLRARLIAAPVVPALALLLTLFAPGCAWLSGGGGTPTDPTTIHTIAQLKLYSQWAKDSLVTGCGEGAVLSTLACDDVVAALDGIIKSTSNDLPGALADAKHLLQNTLDRHPDTLGWLRWLIALIPNTAV